MATTLDPAHVEHEAPPKPPVRGLRRLMQPGWLRAAWVTAATFGLVTGIICLIRWAGENGVASQDIWSLPVLVSFWTIFVPIGWGERQPYQPWRSVNFLVGSSERCPISEQTNLKTTLCRVRRKGR